MSEAVRGDAVSNVSPQSYLCLSVTLANVC